MTSTWIQQGFEAYKSQSKIDRVFLIFWWLGPFLLLVERTPADFWVTIISLGFVVRTVMLGQFFWINYWWIKLVFLFWGICLLSALLSSDPFYSVGEAVAWIRFPLFAMASAFWLGHDRRLLNIMLLTTTFGLLLMCVILSAELFFVGQVNGRLSWPYGDLIPGSYLGKAGLPIAIGLAGAVITQSFRIRCVAAFLIVLLLTFTMLTGERLNFLLGFCGVALVLITGRPSVTRLLLFFSSMVVFALTVFVFLPETWNRFVIVFVDQLPFGMSAPYFRAALPGFIAFTNEPFLGIGPGNFRFMCPGFVTSDYVGLDPVLDCHPHPHQFIIQLLGETGFVGALFGLLFMWTMVGRTFILGQRARSDFAKAVAWVVPFAFFWPISGNADFFGQWHNIFMWSGISLALAISESS